MAPKIFLLGATGFIGGDALHTVVRAHPDYEIVCLARNSDRGVSIASQYAKVRIVYGTLDDEELLVAEAKKADVVLNCTNADHEGAINALLKGLALRETAQRSFYIHTSGAMVVAYADVDRKTFGEASNKVYDDWDGLKTILSIPDHAPHRSADKIVIGAGTDSLKTAIVCPPLIYGQGRGPGNPRSHQVPEMARGVLERKQGFQVGPGENRTAIVHVFDLSNCFLKLVEAAVSGGGNASWGQDGYYFTENGEASFGQVARDVASAAHKQGLIPSEEVFMISDSDANSMSLKGATIWGANFRYHALRARKLLGWSPTEVPLGQTIAEAVQYEAKLLGMLPGYAAKVAG